MVEARHVGHDGLLVRTGRAHNVCGGAGEGGGRGRKEGGRGGFVKSEHRSTQEVEPRGRGGGGGAPPSAASDFDREEGHVTCYNSTAREAERSECCQFMHRFFYPQSDALPSSPLDFGESRF